MVTYVFGFIETVEPCRLDKGYIISLRSPWFCVSCGGSKLAHYTPSYTRIACAVLRYAGHTIGPLPLGVDKCVYIYLGVCLH